MIHPLPPPPGTLSLRRLQLAQDKQLYQSFQEHLECLSTKEKTALLLREEEDLSYQDIAIVMEGTHAQVRTWIFRARKKLLERLKPLLSENDEKEEQTNESKNTLSIL